MVRLYVIPGIVALYLLAGCVPLAELDEAESASTASTDSLEVRLAECRGQRELLIDRLAAIERENLQLDDNNRLLAARLSELQFKDTLTTVAAGDAVPDNRAPAGGAVTDSTVSTGSPALTPSTPADDMALPGGASMSSFYAAGVAPDVEYLRAYQEALRLHHAGNTGEAYRRFRTLLEASSPNDMADNCLFWMGEALRTTGRSRDAATLFTSVLACSPTDKSGSALLARARVLLALDQKNEARQDLDRLLKDFPSSDESQDAKRLLKKLD